MLESELGKDWKNNFSTFNEIPFAGKYKFFY